MKIGVMSDSHDNIPNIKKAVSLFNREKVSFLLHAGDYIAPFSLAALKGLQCDYRGVIGNNDGASGALIKASGGKIKKGVLELILLRNKIALIHDKSELSPKKKYDLVIYGHTHVPEVKKTKSTLFVNPGECCGWLHSKPSVCIVDLAPLSAKIYYL